MIYPEVCLIISSVLLKLIKLTSKIVYQKSTFCQLVLKYSLKLPLTPKDLYLSPDVKCIQSISKSPCSLNRSNIIPKSKYKVLSETWEFFAMGLCEQEKSHFQYIMAQSKPSSSEKAKLGHRKGGWGWDHSKTPNQQGQRKPEVPESARIWEWAGMVRHLKDVG